MSAYYVAVLAMVQGITEFLPVSSSAHLSFLPRILGVCDQGRSFDIFLNIGTLLALCVYYWSDVKSIINGGIDFLKFTSSSDRTFFTYIAVANIPTILVFGIAEYLSFSTNHKYMIYSMIVFSIILYLCDKFGRTDSKNPKLFNWIFMGLAQLCSLIPGASRLGVCLSSMRLMGFNRVDSFKFSMLMSIPPVLGACFLKTFKVFLGNDHIPNIMSIIIGICVAFFFGLLTLKIVNLWIKNRTYVPIVIYRLLFALFLLYYT